MSSLQIDESKYSLISRLSSTSDSAKALHEKFNDGISRLAYQKNAAIVAKTHLRGLTYFIDSKKAFIFLDIQQNFPSMKFFTSDEQIEELSKANWIQGGDNRGSQTFRVQDDHDLSMAL